MKTRVKFPIPGTTPDYIKILEGDDDTVILEISSEDRMCEMTFKADEFERLLDNASLSLRPSLGEECVIVPLDESCKGGVSPKEGLDMLDQQVKRLDAEKKASTEEEAHHVCATAGPAVDLAEEGPLTVKIYGRSNSDDLQLSNMASDMYCSLWEFKENFLRRKVLKGEHAYQSADEALEDVWRNLHEILHDHCVDLDSIP